MKANWKTIGITAVSAALLYYPALKLYQYLVKKNAESGKDDHADHAVKVYSPAYKGKHKGHKRMRDAGTGHA